MLRRLDRRFHCNSQPLKSDHNVLTAVCSGLLSDRFDHNTNTVLLLMLSGQCALGLRYVCCCVFWLNYTWDEVKLHKTPALVYVINTVAQSEHPGVLEDDFQPSCCIPVGHLWGLNWPSLVWPSIKLHKTLILEIVINKSHLNKIIVYFWV